MVVFMRTLLALYLVAGWLPVAMVPSIAIAAGASETIELAGGPTESEACYWLRRANLGRDADYIPGVDAYGREVAPADLNSAPIEAPEMLEFELRVDFADDLPPQSLPTRAYQTVATVRLNPETGEMFIDGERWEPDAGLDVIAACEEATQSQPQTSPH